MNEIITPIFKPILEPVFSPMNTALASIPMLGALIVTLAFFIGTMSWVGVILKNDYVNLDRPNKHIWTDLRLWTVVSMLPHIVVYFYFR